MKEFIDKLISRLEENTIYDKQAIAFMNKYGRGIGFISNKKAIEIVNQLAEEYNIDEVKGDLISMSLLMEALNKSDRDARTDADIQGYCDGWNDVVEIINEQPTTNNNGWILCSERLPDKDMRCLATFESGGIDKIPYLVTNKWGWNGEMADNRVVAWMPLPKPFKPKGEQYEQ